MHHSTPTLNVLENVNASVPYRPQKDLQIDHREAQHFAYVFENRTTWENPPAYPPSGSPLVR